MTQIEKSKSLILKYLKTGSKKDLERAIEENILFKVFTNRYLVDSTELTSSEAKELYESVYELTLLGYEEKNDILFKLFGEFTILEHLYLDMEKLKENIKKYKQELETFLAYNLDFSNKTISRLVNLEQEENKVNNYSLDSEDLMYLVLDEWLSESIMYDDFELYTLKMYFRLADFLTVLYKRLMIILERY